jgi:hypothetical protein
LRAASGQKTRSQALGLGDNEFMPWRLGIVGQSIRIASTCQPVGSTTTNIYPDKERAMPDTYDNTFKSQIKSGKQQIGLWMSLANAYTAEVCATAGFDWLLIDGEHAPNEVRTILEHLQALAATRRTLWFVRFQEMWRSSSA